jgi:hypothetical protein
LGANVFISFASPDLKVATTLCEALETRGFSCWISSRDIAPGDNFQSAIVAAIHDAKVMLLVFTAHSNTSDEMTKELALASQQKLIVVPLRVEEVAPNAAFSYEFATRQWIDLFVDWEKAINQLCERLSRAMPPATADPAKAAAAVAPPAAAPPPAAPKPAAAPGKSNAGLFIGLAAVVVVLLLAAVFAGPMLKGRTPSAAPVAVAPASAPSASAPPAAASPPPEVQAASVPTPAAPAEAAPRPARQQLAAARPARVSADTSSDAYVCAHGDETDSRTIAACDRNDYVSAHQATR